MRRAVVAVRQRRALTRLPLARRRAAAGDAAVERAGLDLLLDEPDCSIDTLRDRPRDLRLHGDRKVTTDVLEERPIRLREVVWIRGEPLHRSFTRCKHLAPVLEMGLDVDIGVDQILD